MRFIIIILLLSLPVLADIDINEFMYAPTADTGGQYNEWVELYNAGNATELNCTLDGELLPQINFSSGEYLVFARRLDLFNQYYPRITAFEHKLTLSNTEDSLSLSCPWGSITVDYDKSWGGFKDNKSLELMEEGTYESSIVDFGTPGRQNSNFEFTADSFGILISEIHPDPFGLDDAPKPFGEWIELYNAGDKPFDLSGLVFYDQDDDNELFIADNKLLEEDLILEPSEYVTVYRDGDTDFALNNDGFEVVRLYDGDELIHQVSYTSSQSGMSWSNALGEYFLTKPTPSSENGVYEDCDLIVSLQSDLSLYQSSEFTFEVYAQKFIGLPQNITVKGHIENEYGEIIKEYNPWTFQWLSGTLTETYTPNLPEGIYQIKFWYDDISCEDADLTDNLDSRIIYINPQYREFDSSVQIEKVYLGSDEKAQWGDQFNVRLQIYKGNATKTAIEMWAEKDGEVVSKRSKLNIYEKFQPYDLTLPLQLHPNCANEEGDDGEVTLIVDGLDQRAEATFDVIGIDPEVCKDYAKYIKAKEKEERAKISFSVLGLSAEVQSGSVVPLNVQLINEDKTHQFEVWTYVYRGSKCYSCAGGEREDNLRKVTLQENEVKPLKFLLPLDEMKPGEYKIKVKLRKDGQKTTKDLTEVIYVKDHLLLQNKTEVVTVFAGDENAEMEQFHGQDSLKSPSRQPLSGLVVYQSSSQKTKELIPVLILITFLLIVILLVIKRA